MSLSSDLRALRFRYLNMQLRDFELQAPDPEELGPLTESEVIGDLTGKHAQRFLSYFSRRGLVRLGLKFGIIQSLRERGFVPHMKLVTTDPQQHLLRLYDGFEEKPEHLILEVAAHLETSMPKPALHLPAGRYSFLVVDWLLLQNPRDSFSATRPRLPGQQFPGLRIGQDIGEVITLIGERLKQDGVLTFPNHYHNGLLYSRKMMFANPKYQAELMALGRDLSSLNFAERSWAIELGCIEDAAGKPYTWQGTEMIFPISASLREHFNGPGYRAAVEHALEKLHYRLDMDKFVRLYEPL